MSRLTSPRPLTRPPLSIAMERGWTNLGLMRSHFFDLAGYLPRRSIHNLGLEGVQGDENPLTAPRGHPGHPPSGGGIGDPPAAGGGGESQETSDRIENTYALRKQLDIFANIRPVMVYSEQCVTIGGTVKGGNSGIPTPNSNKEALRVAGKRCQRQHHRRL